MHRIGRTGRAGRTGTGITLVTPEQEGEVAEIVNELGLADRFAAAGLNPEAARGRKGGGGGNRGRRPQPQHGGRPKGKQQPRGDRRGRHR